MKKTLAAFALMAFGSLSAFAGTWTGYIADSKCKHTDGTADHVACTEKCVKGGAEVVFVTADNKVLKIDAASLDKVQAHLGHKVTITGKVTDDTVKIDKVKM